MVVGSLVVGVWVISIVGVLVVSVVFVVVGIDVKAPGWVVISEFDSVKFDNTKDSNTKT